MSETKTIYIMLDASEPYSKWFLDYIKKLEELDKKSVSHTTAFQSLVATLQQQKKEIEERDGIISRIPEFKKKLCEIVAGIVWETGNKIIIEPEAVEKRINTESKNI